MQKFGRLFNAELWKLRKEKRTRLLLVAMLFLPWVIRLIAELMLKTDMPVDVGKSIVLIPLLTGIITVILAISSLVTEFELATFKTLIIQGVTRRQILLAKASAIIFVSVLAVFLWELSLALASRNLNVPSHQMFLGLLTCTLTSLAYTGLIFAVTVSSSSLARAALGLLAYLVDMAMSILTQSTLPVVGENASSWLARTIWHVAPFSISVNSVILSTSPVLPDALPSMGLLGLFGIVGLGVSMFVFSVRDMSG
jgi:ABC-type transport system involved in multi-copper enzyme maturation permease subunit